LAIDGNITSRAQVEKIRAEKHQATGVKHHLSFNLFKGLNAKEKNLSVRDVFIKQLLQVKGLGLDKAMAIVERYPTLPRYFLF